MLGVGLILKSGLIVGSFIAIPLATKSLVEGDFFSFPEKNENFVVKETGNEIGPIFNCNYNTKNYKVYLVPETGEWTKDTTDNNITLKIVEKEETNSKEQIVWNSKDHPSNNWTKWKIQIVGDDVTLYTQDHQRKENFGFTAFCTKKDNRVTLKTGAYEDFWEVNDGKEQKKAQLQCQKNDSLSKCEIKFSESSPFQWSSGFNPKITIPAEKR